MINRSQTVPGTRPGRLNALFFMLVLTALCFMAPGAGAMEPRVFASPEEEARFAALTEELRCTVCQNQSLADSDAPLAQDLRDEIFTMLEQGNSDGDIKRFMVDRYGDFVLYRPPVRGNTLLLWLAPLLLLSTGAVVMAFTIRRHRIMLAEEALEEVEGGHRADESGETSHAKGAAEAADNGSSSGDTRGKAS